MTNNGVARPDLLAVARVRPAASVVNRNAVIFARPYAPESHHGRIFANPAVSGSLWHGWEGYCPHRCILIYKENYSRRAGICKGFCANRRAFAGIEGEGGKIG